MKNAFSASSLCCDIDTNRLTAAVDPCDTGAVEC
jgi:hypothetical protein